MFSLRPFSAQAFSTLVLPAASNVTVAPGAGAIVFTGKAPSSDATVAPGAGSVVFTGFAPSANTTAAPGAGSIVLTGLAPGADVYVAPGVGSIIFTGLAPSVIVDSSVSPGAGAIAFTGQAPNVDLGVIGVVATPSGAFDAGPSFGKWFNLAFKAGSSGVRRTPRTGIGAEIEAEVARREATPERVVEEAIVRIAEVKPADEHEALRAVARQEESYRALVREQHRAHAVRQAFIDAIVARAKVQLDIERMENRRRAEEDAVIMLMMELQ